MKIAFAQVKDQGSFERNIKASLDYLELAGKVNVEVLCFPEMQFSHFFPRYCNHRRPFQWAEEIPGPIIDLFQSKAKDLGIVIILNLMERLANNFYNSSPVIDSNGRLTGVSRMVHVPQIDGYFAQSYFTPGCGDFMVYDTSYGRIGVLVSYDRHFPEASRALALHGAEIVLIPGFITEDQNALVFKAELQAMAYQNGYYVGMCNRVGEEGQTRFVGRSILVNPEGEVVVEGSNQDELIVMDVDLEEVKRERCRTPYLKLRRPDEYFHIIKQI